MNRTACIFALAVTASSASAADLGSIFTLGDSLTGGTSSGAPNSYRGPLDAMLTGNGHSYQWVGPQYWGSFPSGKANRHAGFGGWTVEELLNGKPGQTSWGDLDDWYAATGVDTLIFQAPVNGFAWGWDYGNPAVKQMAWDWNELHMRDVLDRSFAKNPDMVVHFGSMARRSLNPEPFNSYAADMDLLVRDLVADYQGQGRSIFYVDVYGTIDPSQHLIADGVHFNDVGASVLAGAYSESIEAVPEPSLMVGLATAASLWMSRRRSKNS